MTAIRIMPLGDSVFRGIIPASGFPGTIQFNGGCRGPLLTMLLTAGYDVTFVGSQGDPTARGTR